MLGNALALVPRESQLVAWCRNSGIDLDAALDGAIAAGAVRSVRGHVPGKGVRTFVEGATFMEQFEAFLGQIRAGARAAPTPPTKRSLRGFPRKLLGRPRVLRVVESLCRRPEHFVRLARRTPFWPNQNPKEISWLLNLLAAKHPRWILEVGTATGGTLYLLSKVVRSDARIVTIDIEQKCDPDLLMSFARKDQEIHLLVGDSTAEPTVQHARSLLPDGVDCLFIDGDHSYEGVRRDFEIYSPWVRPGGVIVFHDIVDDNATRYGFPTGGYAGGVPRFWRELKQRFPHKERFEDERQDGLGIGVILRPAAAP